MSSVRSETMPPQLMVAYSQLEALKHGETPELPRRLSEKQINRLSEFEEEHPSKAHKLMPLGRRAVAMGFLTAENFEETIANFASFVKPPETSLDVNRGHDNTKQVDFDPNACYAFEERIDPKTGERQLHLTQIQGVPTELLAHVRTHGRAMGLDRDLLNATATKTSESKSPMMDLDFERLNQDPDARLTPVSTESGDQIKLAAPHVLNVATQISEQKHNAANEREATAEAGAVAEPVFDPKRDTSMALAA